MTTGFMAVLLSNRFYRPLSAGQGGKLRNEGIDAAEIVFHENDFEAVREG
jgi:hypothetical protein